MEFEKELSYKQICKEFGESESSSGRVRQLQLNRWQEDYNGNAIHSHYQS